MERANYLYTFEIKFQIQTGEMSIFFGNLKMLRTLFKTSKNDDQNDLKILYEHDFFQYFHLYAAKINIFQI